MLYQPRSAEIEPLIEHACSQWPQLHDRAQRAKQILLANGVVWTGCHWAVQSQRSGELYIQNGQCPCPDFANGAPVIQGKKFCKHKLAVTTYWAILRGYLRGYAYRVADSENFPYLFDLDGRPICRLTIDRDGRWSFADYVSIYDFSAWLHGQGALDVTEFFPFKLTQQEEQTPCLVK